VALERADVELVLRVEANVEQRAIFR